MIQDWQLGAYDTMPIWCTVSYAAATCTMGRDNRWAAVSESAMHRHLECEGAKIRGLEGVQCD